MVSNEDLKAQLESLFYETKKTFEKLPEFRKFAGGLKEDFANLAASMTHQLEVDFQAYNPVNFFHALDLHASENGQTS
jgi:hypothetical protein